LRLKLDENLPATLLERLTAPAHDVDTVPAEGIAGKDDTTVWQAAQAAGRLLLTQDLDFSDIRQFLPGTHHGLMLIRLQTPSRAGWPSELKPYSLPKQSKRGSDASS